MQLLKKILSEIKPSKEEEKKLYEKINKILKKINSVLDSQKAVLGGSGVKGTWLRNQYDADIFVMFDYGKYKNRSDEISNILEGQLKKIFSGLKRLHGSRDYFQISENKFTFEIIPVLNIKKSSDAKNITDVSPLHAKWVLRHKKYAEDIRLLKQFCKSAKVYGAESYIKGFSGYICEILTIHYKGFLNTIKNSAKWRDKVVIDVENYYKGKNPLSILNKSKTYSPLVIIDPVQKDRNAAAAISQEKFEKFKSVCKEFLKKPSENFFSEKRFSISDIKKSAGKNKLIFLEAKPLTGKLDVVGCKLLKVFEYLSQKFLENDFNIINSGWSWDGEGKAIYYFVFPNKKLPELKKHEGPLLSLSEHVEKFKKCHKKTFTKKNRIYASIKRGFTEPEILAKTLISDSHIKENVKSIRIISSKANSHS